MRGGTRDGTVRPKSQGFVQSPETTQTCDKERKSKSLEEDVRLEFMLETLQRKELENPFYLV